MGKKKEHPPEERVIRYSLRLPRDLYDDLDVLATQSGWTLHAEMMQGLHEHVVRRKRERRRAAG